MMYILPGIIENDFENFTKGISVIQKNMSKIFYGKSNLYASKNITKIFNYLILMGIVVMVNHHGGQLDLFFVRIISLVLNFLRIFKILLN